MPSRAKNILSALDNIKEITILNADTSSEGKILHITANTYNIKSGITIDTIDIIFNDLKKRQKRTLDKLGLTKEQLNNGIDEESGLRQISEYFINHDSLIAGINIKSLIKIINKKLEMYSLKKINGLFFDIFKESEYCGIEFYKNKKSFEYILALTEQCIKRYKKISEIENNKYDCVLNYAYYRELEYGKKQHLIYCNTTIGVIFYDIDKDEWAIAKKEQKRTGLIIENFDIENIKQQIRLKYKVRNMSEFIKYNSKNR